MCTSKFWSSSVARWLYEETGGSRLSARVKVPALLSNILDQNRLLAVDYIASRFTVAPLCWIGVFATRPPVFVRIL
jgi:hypothetical protein